MVLVQMKMINDWSSPNAGGEDEGQCLVAEFVLASPMDDSLRLHLLSFAWLMHHQTKTRTPYPFPCEA